MADLESYQRIKEEVERHGAELIAVSKKKPVSEIVQLQSAGQKIFGENYVQELMQKHSEVPNASWHFIGHLQTNKVKQVIPLVTMVQSVDSLKLLKEIDKQSETLKIKTKCLIEIYIAGEETKTGFPMDEATKWLDEGHFSEFQNVEICGLMGMASFTEDNDLIRREFKSLRTMFERYKSKTFNVLSMGMTSDYRIALEEGSTMIRIGSAIFGSR